MHLLRKIFWLKVVLAAAIVFALGFVIAFEIGVETVRDADQWNTHTATVLDAIAESQIATESAVNAGRLALIGQSTQTDGARELALQRLAIVKRLTIDNEMQMKNIDDLDSLLRRRFEIQDRQAAAAQRSNGSITLDAGTTTESVNVTHAAENAFSNLRIEELRLLQVRDTERGASQWRIINAMRLFFWLMIAAIVFSLCRLIVELRQKQEVADHIRERSTMVGTISKSDAQSLLRLIEEGESRSRGTFVLL